jgi:hypothetical protein
LILSLLLGKERSNGEGQYIRHAGSDKVYLIPERLSVDSAVDDWLKKDLLAIESAQIAGIKLQNGEKRSFAVNRDSAEAEWKSTVENLNTPDSERIKKILDRLALLSFARLYKKAPLITGSLDCLLSNKGFNSMCITSLATTILLSVFLDSVALYEVLNFQPLDCTSLFTSFKIFLAILASVGKLPVNEFTGASPIVESIVLTASNSVVLVVIDAMILFLTQA